MAGSRAIRAAGALLLAALVSAVLVVPASSGEPQRRYTPAGQAAAKRVALKLSDLPAGWKATKSGGGGGKVTCKSFDPDESDLTTIGHADVGFESADGLSNIASITGIFKTAGQAQTSWNRVVRPAMLGCLASILESSGTKDAPIKVISKGKHPLAVPGKRHAAYRVVADVTADGQHLKAYLDVIIQGGGQADTVLLITSVLSPPSAALERKLASVVAGRLPK